MKTRTFKQMATAKQRAELFSANVLGDAERAEDFAEMSVEDYADKRGVTIQNPQKGGERMASKIAELQQELDEAYARIEELEQERTDVLDALGLEIVNDESDESDESDEETD